MVKQLLVPAVAGLCVVSCAVREDSSPQGAEPHLSKIINTKTAETVSGQLLVKLNDVSDKSVSEMMAMEGVEDVQPLFVSVPGKEEMERRFELDRWYALGLSEGADETALARNLSALAAVRAVQYGLQYKRASDCITYPYFPSEEPAVKAAASVFNDPMLKDQWHYVNTGDQSVAASAYKGADIDVQDVWSSLTAGDNSIIVAVIDEGVKYTHPDLVANMWTNPKETENGKDDDGNGYEDDIHGYNFVDNGPITWAEGVGKNIDSGHGTHCAGTIAAVNNNGVGVSGVAGGTGNSDGVKIMSCQIFSRNSGGSSIQTARAYKYAADNGASVISCSFGYSAGVIKSDGTYKRECLAEYDALKYFEASKNNPVLDGGVAIFAAGNDATNYSAYPGALSDVISVSSFGPDYLPAYYTNYGPGCNIAAPGGEAYLNPWTSFKGMVLSTLPSELNDGSDYGYMQGTSMACPHVSGIAALGLSYAKKLGKTFTLSEFKNLLLAAANDMDPRIASGKKDYHSSANVPSTPMSSYRHKMGTGSIDTWKFMMNIEGIPCLIAESGKNQWLSLDAYFGTASKSLTFTEIEVSKEAESALGLAEAPYIKYGKLWIHPTKCGSAKIKVNAIAGGDSLGGEASIGGMEISRTISIIVRSHVSDNGGWL